VLSVTARSSRKTRFQGAGNGVKEGFSQIPGLLANLLWDNQLRFAGISRRAGDSRVFQLPVRIATKENGAHFHAPFIGRQRAVADEALWRR
jgi:hypothetical protein